jgi:hypothetical protein
MMSVRPGDHLGPYVLIRALGSGGMGVVFEACHQPLGRRVAIKVLHSETSAGATGAVERARFLREGRAAAQVRHPHVVEVFDFGVEQDVPFLVMELIEGETLADRIAREGALPLPQVAALLLPVLSAVSELHAARILHRDLKPANVLLARDRAGAVVPKVSDFGVSRMEDGSPALTGSNVLVGTYAYLAAELLRGGQRATEKTDLYALAVTLYECATGQRPFAQASPYDLLHAIVYERVVPPSARNALLPEAFDAVVLRAMNRDPAARFGGAQELARALLPFAEPAVRARWESEFDAPGSGSRSAAAAAARAPAPASAPRPRLFGRDAELASVRASLARVVAGQGALLLIAGEAGIGKTGLADAFAAEAGDLGMAVAWGRCWESGGAPSYWPWIQVFRALGLENPFGRQIAALAAVAAVTASALPALPPLPVVETEAPDVRFRMFDRAAQALRTAALARPIAVVLDDLHAADVPSLLLLHLVARGLRSGGRLALLGTYREAEARAAGEAGTLLAKIAREGNLLLPARLTRGEVEIWVRSQRPGATDSTLGRVHALSEGNPFFVQELLRAQASLDGARLPHGLTAAIGEHLGRVSSAARDLLGVASVLGREWTEDDLLALAAEGGADARACIEEARSVGLVTVASGSSRCAFAHILIREQLYADLDPRRRAELHARAGERFAARSALAEAAHHLLEGGGGERAASVALDAANLALRTLAFEDAARLASRGAQAAPPSSELSCELEITLAESLLRTGDPAGGKQASLRAAGTARRLGLPRLLARAALACGYNWGIVDPIRVELLGEALAALPESDDLLRARTMARLADAKSPPQRSDQIGEVIALARDAIAMARRLADDDTMLFVLRFAGSVLSSHISVAERFETVEETMHLAARLERPALLFERGPWWAGVLRERGLRAEANAALDAYVSLAREFPPHYRWRPPLVLASHAMLDGDFDRADALAAQGLALAEEAGVFQGRLYWVMQRVVQALLVREDPRILAANADRILSVLAVVEKVTPWGRASAALVLAMLGRETEARRRFSPQEVDPADFPSVLGNAYLPLFLRDRELGERLLPALVEAGSRIPFYWMGEAAIVFGPTPGVAGEIAALLGRAEEARGLLDQAIEVAERIGSPPMVARMRARRAALGA